MSQFNTPADIIELQQYLLRKYNARNTTYQQLRKFYNAEYFTGTEIQGIKLIYNIMASAVDKFTDFLIQTPDFRVIPLGQKKQHLIQADNIEKLLMSQYQVNEFEILQSWITNLQSMLGMFAVEVRPVFGDKDKVVQIDTPPPEYVLPLPKSDNIRDLEAVIILGDDYNKHKDAEQFTPQIRHDQKIQQTNVIKFYDKEKIVVMRDKEVIMTLHHGLGFIPIIIGQNRVKPHFIEGISDMEQAAGLQQYFNELLSHEGDIIEYAADPIVVTSGYSGDPLPTGPGQHWQLPKDADARILQWQGTPPSMKNMMNVVQTGIEDLLGIGDIPFGRNVPSGTSGAAVRSFTSGLQSSLVRKQVMMGNAYNRINEVILKMIEKLMPGKEITIRGTQRNNFFFASMKGADIMGNYRTQTIWPAGILDQPSRIDIELSKLNAKIQSRQTTMENVGITSPRDEKELIRQEQEADLERELLAQGGGGQIPGVSQSKQNELNAGAEQLQNLDAGQGDTQSLVQAIQGIGRIKGDVFFGGQEGKGFMIILTDMVDKSTIVNRVPKQFKGRLKFRKFKDGDEELPIIIEQEEESAPAQGAPPLTPPEQ